MKKLTFNEHIESITNTLIPKQDIHDILQGLMNAGLQIEELIHQSYLKDQSYVKTSVNATGDDAKPLDILSNDVFKDIVSKSDLYACYASEEEEALFIPNNASGNYLLAVDPLDGSSNVDVNVSVGSIISIFNRKGSDKICENQFIQKGSQQVFSAYILYGTITELVYTAGQGVYRFILDRESKEFYQVGSTMNYPNKIYCYSINESLTPTIEASIVTYIDSLKASSVTGRYVGSLVADFHRNLLKGGIYMYPATKTHAKGKLRLLYEAFPLAFISEQAQGGASALTKPIMDLTCHTLHERTPLYIGNLPSLNLLAEQTKHLIAR
ncbi:fructose-bisphosphatase class I [Candidatus Marinamargulisbacteria bacterium SCGC AG-414-C22]|nr:fructose-bisphosphatase class I [Candidatus Marinamargulisbacteria bacterium SCGC AG-414-C22]